MKGITSFFMILMWSLLLMASSTLNAEDLFLRDNLQKAQRGDFLVTSSSKTLTLMHIYDKNDQLLTIEEISIPESKRHSDLTWKEWVSQNAPDHTNWVMYEIDLRNGRMLRYYSFTKKNWFEIPDADNFLSKLLNLKFTKVAENSRKRVGPHALGTEKHGVWQPRMIVEGQAIPGVLFDAWRTKWPRDGSDLSGKSIEVYTPRDTDRFLSYFPYWLQIDGTVGNAKIRIIDSGNKLQSLKPSLKTCLDLSTND